MSVYDKLDINDLEIIERPEKELSIEETNPVVHDNDSRFWVNYAMSLIEDSRPGAKEFLEYRISDFINQISLDITRRQACDAYLLETYGIKEALKSLGKIRYY